MKKQCLIGLSTVLTMSTSAHAANLAMIASPPTMFSFFVLVIAGFCLFVSFQVWNQVKGGLLSRSWQMFLLGFVLLAVSQLFNVLTSIELMAPPGYVVPGLLTLMAGAFLYGAYNTRKTLS